MQTNEAAERAAEARQRFNYQSGAAEGEVILFARHLRRAYACQVKFPR